MTSKKPDNYMFLMHKISLTTNSGSLTLSGTNGPIIWEPCLDKPTDENNRFNLEKNEFSELKIFEITEEVEETYNDMMKLSWVEAISKSVIDFTNNIEAEKVDLREQQYLISAIEAWRALSRELGQSNTIQPYKKTAIKMEDLI
ncbi:TPA: thiazolinyl imide reductase [Streptococcus agalactiae]